MQFKLKEDDILDFLELNFPDQSFEKRCLLVGQNKKAPLDMYYFGKDFLAVLNIDFNTFEYIRASEVDYSEIEKITLKEGLLYRKMIIETEDIAFKYGTSKALMSDFQNENFKQFIHGEKTRVIFKDGQFI
ncbi:hypothetical protein [Staphylococcus saccharolyticus]|uniref:Uncharacterized protein n=1 Tax=Staphylococcus saccharolyticus TaxID=33028 RepID=A0A380H9W1_9STAP|nr:hypothetical protein [Staphylococcus saccharolyticus]MBL7565842.1 hypothetical protein [Staphylococcus saccharolyticus]MBL7572076.1 hypothetical protein [Staphylococcus saccharolyticus]QQB97642.1 hypothetical protein I6I31_05805 [Staphylococcus saccharolyticus]QRJ66506.1 hypothetical protein DMB76_010045 [Staphylococcus saccharolyticus]RTX96178.1 hypothetical protein CD145_06410 [Staphylococcus saccharolyticus]